MKRVDISNDGVPMHAFRRTRLTHVSDLPEGHEECFGGDKMGHWNVGRINRLLDAFSAPVVELPVATSAMRDFAMVGAPDPSRAQLHAMRGRASMPPLSFVTMIHPEKGIDLMLVDGHHRMLALYLLGEVTVPARVLPAALADDCRIIEMSESVVFPEFAPVVLKRHPVSGLKDVAHG